MKRKCFFLSFLFSLHFSTYSDPSSNFWELNPIGRVNGQAVQDFDLPKEDLLAIQTSQRRLLQNIKKALGKKYLKNWFEQYQKKRNFETLVEAKQHYYEQFAIVDDKQVQEFLKKHGNDFQEKETSDAQKQKTARNYLEELAHHRADQEIIDQGFRDEKITISSFREKNRKILGEIVGGTELLNIKKNPQWDIHEFGDLTQSQSYEVLNQLETFAKYHTGRVQITFHVVNSEDKIWANNLTSYAYCAGKQVPYSYILTAFSHQKFDDKTMNNTLSQISHSLSLNDNALSECEKSNQTNILLNRELVTNRRMEIRNFPQVVINHHFFQKEVNFHNLQSVSSEN